MDPIARAYAILGLRRGCTSDELKATYRQLVKRWHPDRYSGDPAGQLEASARLREINGALRIVADDISAAQGPRTPVRPAEETIRPDSPDHAPGRPLTRSEIDAIVGVLRTESPIDALLQWISLVGPFAAAFLMLVPTRGRPSRFGDTIFGFALLGLGIAMLVRRRLQSGREGRS